MINDYFKYLTGFSGDAQMTTLRISDNGLWACRTVLKKKDRRSGSAHRRSRGTTVFAGVMRQKKLVPDYTHLDLSWFVNEQVDQQGAVEGDVLLQTCTAEETKVSHRLASSSATAGYVPKMCTAVSSREGPGGHLLLSDKAQRLIAFAKVVKGSGSKLISSTREKSGSVATEYLDTWWNRCKRHKCSRRKQRKCGAGGVNGTKVKKVKAVVHHNVDEGAQVEAKEEATTFVALEAQQAAEALLVLVGSKPLPPSLPAAADPLSLNQIGLVVKHGGMTLAVQQTQDVALIITAGVNNFVAQGESQRDTTAGIVAQGESQRDTTAGIVAQGESQRDTTAGIVAQGESQRDTTAGIVAQGESQRDTTAGIVAQGENQRDTTAGIVAQGENQRDTTAGIVAQGESQRDTTAGIQSTILVPQIMECEEQQQLHSSVLPLKCSAGGTAGGGAAAEGAEDEGTVIGRKLVSATSPSPPSYERMHHNGSHTIMDWPSLLCMAEKVKSLSELPWSSIMTSSAAEEGGDDDVVDGYVDDVLASEASFCSRMKMSVMDWSADQAREMSVLMHGMKSCDYAVRLMRIKAREAAKQGGAAMERQPTATGGSKRAIKEQVREGIGAEGETVGAGMTKRQKKKSKNKELVVEHNNTTMAGCIERNYVMVPRNGEDAKEGGHVITPAVPADLIAPNYKPSSVLVPAAGVDHHDVEKDHAATVAVQPGLLFQSAKAVKSNCGHPAGAKKLFQLPTAKRLELDVGAAVCVSGADSKEKQQQQQLISNGSLAQLGHQAEAAACTAGTQQQADITRTNVQQQSNQLQQVINPPVAMNCSDLSAGGWTGVVPDQVKIASNNALSLKGIFYVKEYADSLRKRQVEGGSSVKPAACIELEGGRRVTPAAMEKEAGMEKRKKWKNSLLAVHLGKQLKMDKFLGMFGLS
ncbi:hypothetical protein CEUSTIGMA_g10372.t1 [Chlamydomonas eustigma]|uniref:SAND domain-containing protein n=1 Tax=Chlamydomonas eustigma TaxID=1157962 RepID=A0A250XIN6_9CHLO|nr:hypothetical protein CEUSTIGMA_g10372.t1 [Chlamydomonas eustigma]|eukprot:GAX82945.1 hypothetical protein CEUSTIGMA_g10372.t1 [Chlamydomonas eustigma]